MGIYLKSLINDWWHFDCFGRLVTKAIFRLIDGLLAVFYLVILWMSPNISDQWAQTAEIPRLLSLLPISHLFWLCLDLFRAEFGVVQFGYGLHQFIGFCLKSTTLVSFSSWSRFTDRKNESVIRYRPTTFLNQFLQNSGIFKTQNLCEFGSTNRRIGVCNAK